MYFFIYVIKICTQIPISISNPTICEKSVTLCTCKMIYSVSNIKKIKTVYMDGVSREI